MEVNGFPNYLIYEDGRVWSKKGKGLFLKMRPTTNNYLGCNKGKRKTFTLHRLLGQHYIPNPNNHPEIDHIDRNRQNNNLNNLRWVSSSTNQLNSNFRPSSSNHKYIFPKLNKNKSIGYRLQIRGYRNKTICLKTFKTLQDALHYKFYMILKINLMKKNM